MSHAAKTIFSILSYRVLGLPLSAAAFLAVGVLWWNLAFIISNAKRRRSLPLLCWLPTFLCTVIGGCLLFLFCDDFILAAASLFCTALLYALPCLLLSGKAAPKEGDSP